MEGFSLRWRIAFLVSAAIAISYLDRQTLPVAIKAIEKDIPISNEQFSALQSSFLLAYALMYGVGGRLVDLLGTRRGFMLVMSFWSFACVSHAAAIGFPMLIASRFLLGVGEGGGFPAATRVAAEWFSMEERATAMGIINAGTALGAVVAPPLIASVLGFADWRWVFVLTGALGLFWVAWWRKTYFVPEEPAALPGRMHTANPRADTASTFEWVQLLRVRETWGLMIAKFLSDAAWFFYLFWLPKYLYEARNFDIKAIGMFAWLPGAAAGVGCLMGGMFSSYLVQRHFSVIKARKLALGLSAAIMPLAVLVPHVTITWTIVLFCVAYLGQQSWSTLVMVLPADLFPQGVVGSVAGLVGFGGAMGGIVFGQIVGYLLDHGFGYGLVFGIAGVLHIVAFAIILSAIPAVSRLSLKGKFGHGGAQ